MRATCTPPGDWIVGATHVWLVRAAQVPEEEYAVRAWGDANGTTTRMRALIKQYVKTARVHGDTLVVSDPKDFSSRSMRSGFATGNFRKAPTEVRVRVGGMALCVVSSVVGCGVPARCSWIRWTTTML